MDPTPAMTVNSLVILLVLHFFFTLRTIDTQEIFDNGVVATDMLECSRLGASILKKNGSAVDAAITSTLCMGVAYPHAMGIGGGMVMTIYQKETQKSYVIDAREVAPGTAHERMYTDLDTVKFGPLGIAVPGELKGLAMAHRRFGNLPWEDVVMPVVRYCEKGHKVSRHMAVALKLQSQKYNMSTQPGMKVFMKGGNIYAENDTIKRPDLARTLHRIARQGAKEFYEGQIGKQILQDIRKRGSILTNKDLESYRAKFHPAISTTLSSGVTLHTSPPPTSGPLLILFMNMIDALGMNATSNKGDANQLSTFHRIIESLKFTYAQRTKFGDPDFVRMENLMKNLTSKSMARDLAKKIDDKKTYNKPSHYGATAQQSRDGGTGHVSVLAPNGDAVSVTSTINSYFGCGIMSETTGVILNNQMDDFSFPNLATNSGGLPPMPPNFIKPGKRPVSSAVPTVVTSKSGNVIASLGAAGGLKITSTVGVALVRLLMFGEKVNEAMDDKRFHHQVTPNTIFYENPFPPKLMDGLQRKGHTFTRAYGTFSCISMVGRASRGKVFGMADTRRLGQTAGM